MIKLENVTVKFEDKLVLNKLNFNFENGKKYAIVGESGCGKTTVLNTISSLVKFHGNVSKPNNTKISFVFQEPRLYDWLSVIENVTMVMNIPKAYAKQKAEELLSVLGLADNINSYPAELSGGMKQRVSIARALAYEPDILLLDEPFRALDDQTKIKVADYVFSYVKDKTVIMVTHDLSDLCYTDIVLRIESTPVTELVMVKSSI